MATIRTEAQANEAFARGCNERALWAQKLARPAGYTARREPRQPVSVVAIATAVFFACGLVALAVDLFVL